MLVHVFIRSHCVVARQLQLIVTQQLAVGQVGVSIYTLLGTHEVLIEEIQLVDILRPELCRVDLHVAKETRCLVHSCDVRTANP